ncbi:aminoglycoside phosphotransferase family protein [Nonomuraea maheshkhaliensis]
MTRTDDDLLAVARDQLGPVTPIQRFDLPSRVQLLVAGDGQRYILKRHDRPGRYRAEADAYSSWVPSLGGNAPTLIHADPDSLSLLLTVVPGRHATQLQEGSTGELRAYREAGRVLRLIHQAPPGPHAGTRAPAHLAERMRWWAGRAHSAALISASHLHALHAWADRMAAETLETAVCHLDFQPRNWIISPTGQIGVFDFEHSRLDVRVRDFSRLEHRFWGHNPGLREAFFDGYGCSLGPAEQDLLRRFGPLEAVTAMVRGYETGNTELLAHGCTLIADLY